MELDLKGKTVIITGGASNIGKAITLGFASEKTKIMLWDIDDTHGKEVSELALQRGAEACEFYKVDVTNLEQVKDTMDLIKEKHSVIDILVNVVGWDSLNLFIKTSPEFWEKVINLNYWSVLNTTKSVLPHMVEQNKGSIINIGSDAGRVGERFEAVYAGTKGAVIAFSKALAREMGRNNIRVNVVCPGTTVPASEEDIGSHSLWREGVMTSEQLDKAKKLYPLGRLGQPEDIANAVLFLSSDKSSFITGQTLSVSGGYSMM